MVYGDTKLYRSLQRKHYASRRVEVLLVPHTEFADWQVSVTGESQCCRLGLNRVVGENCGIINDVAMFYLGAGQDLLNVKNYGLILDLTRTR